MIEFDWKSIQEVLTCFRYRNMVGVSINSRIMMSKYSVQGGSVNLFLLYVPLNGHWKQYRSRSDAVSDQRLFCLHQENVFFLGCVAVFRLR